MFEPDGELRQAFFRINFSDPGRQFFLKKTIITACFLNDTNDRKYL